MKKWLLTLWHFLGGLVGIVLGLVWYFLRRAAASVMVGLAEAFEFGCRVFLLVFMAGFALVLLWLLFGHYFAPVQAARHTIIG